MGEAGKEVELPEATEGHVADRIFAGHARRPSTLRDYVRHQEGPGAFLRVVTFGVCLCK